MHDTISRSGFDAFALPADPAVADAWLGASYDDEIRAAESAIRELAPLDLLVVDHYSIDARWETVMRDYAGRIAVVDDLFDRAHDCDVLLNQNLGAEQPGRYEGLIPTHARQLLGPSFALLREEFREYTTHARSRTGSVDRVLVFISGFDPQNETEKALRGLASLEQPVPQVDVVLPPDAPKAGSVQRFCNENGFAYRGHVQAMAPLMNAADLAIGAMGSAAWERCALGLPAVVVTLAENQRPSAQACARAGAVAWLGDALEVNETAIANTVETLRTDALRVREMSQRARAIVGAQVGTFGTDRVVDALMGVVNV
jgi:UDP-2,4-diacetamido-2,4,6-trideoxy-beta-L-altropyranose hydrolase